MTSALEIMTTRIKPHVSLPPALLATLLSLQTTGRRRWQPGEER
jgi:hypothetical protein